MSRSTLGTAASNRGVGLAGIGIVRLGRVELIGIIGTSNWQVEIVRLGLVELI